MVPGLLTWSTILAAVLLSYFQPVWVAVFIIIFDLYWFFMALNILIHLVHTYHMLGAHKKIDWSRRCEDLRSPKELLHQIQEQLKSEPDGWVREILSKEIISLKRVVAEGRKPEWDKIMHLILLPTVSESYHVLETSIASYAAADFPTQNKVMVLATESRGSSDRQEIARKLQERFEASFSKFIITVHPDDVPGEAKVKGANITYAAKQAKQYFDQQGIELENILVSAFDSDTVVPRDYFSKLTYTFLTAKKPLRSSYQPTPLFHNNVWDTPAVNRVAAASNSFWQMIETSRPDRLITFSSHSLSFKTLVEVGYWPVDLIPDDSRIFWKCFIHFDGDYRVEPLYTTVSLDAVALEGYSASLFGQYKQYLRWAWGVIDVVYIIDKFWGNKRIPLGKRLLNVYRLSIAHYFWANAALMIAALGWLPLILGGDRFSNEVFALNLPSTTSTIMTISMAFLVVSVIINFIMLPDRPKNYGRVRSIGMVVQWVLVPVFSLIILAMPAIEAQTRLMIGKPLERFWVTPKYRKLPKENA